MKNELLVYALLLDVGLVSCSEYSEYLDALFIKMPDNDLLLELEWCSSDMQKTVSTIRYNCYEYDVDYDAFGRFLFLKLEEIYRQNKMDIKNFGEKTYKIWLSFPEAIHCTEPFWTLNFSGDSLSWGDEKRTRELYEKTFRFYKNT